MSENNQTWRQRIFYTTQTDDRSRMRAVANNLILHLHPTKVPAPALRWTYTWGLGGLSATLALLLIITGVILTFRYDASVERAYTSIQYLETQVAFGSLVRALHHWSANLLVVTAFLHLIRVFLTGGFKLGRSTNWIIGLVLLLIVVAFNFTGYLLPWDQLAYWAITVGTSLLSYVPLVGTAVANFLLGGPEVGQAALRNFYAIHVAVLPALLVMMMSYHFWKVRKDGGISQPPTEPGERVERLTTIPHLVQIEFAAAAVLILGLFVWAAFVPAPLEALADPSHPTNPAKAAWYFLGLQELLLHMHPLAALLLPGIILGAFVAIPYLDKQEDNIGRYFRSAVGKQIALLAALYAIGLIPLLVLLDEYWLDLPALLPGLPTLISNGLIPLALTLGGLAAVYLLFRTTNKANKSEALVGLFVFVMVSLLLLTLIGIFFRGPNMALVLPF
ncbi:MAG: cytochrome b N-terminal domain-containing protein [Chloroflexi bacterium]|jgi:quinol-cytochrome oxidoreductase complex cytochrome b subunit|nr:cytochrome b N-terminal domain-containing protein [Chloroflexota bacterium]MBK6709329.1 cytochrome b N-terminal domain-containing protein [Chloroflexota bacterium]MBK7177762.1 cytochrome b N-terminal domain-containing protein [Chloroflexota bacterium]MBK7915101.1 cytochrome b N-terminal domain-containing protein [Chloroflexota bacterium]MBP7592369.1 cytochrome b N-terminal domain-containing protein [Chloroflexota bacterium]